MEANCVMKNCKVIYKIHFFIIKKELFTFANIIFGFFSCQPVQLITCFFFISIWIFKNRLEYAQAKIGFWLKICLEYAQIIQEKADYYEILINKNSNTKTIITVTKVFKLSKVLYSKQLNNYYNNKSLTAFHKFQFAIKEGW